MTRSFDAAVSAARYNGKKSDEMFAQLCLRGVKVPPYSAFHAVQRVDRCRSVIAKATGFGTAKSVEKRVCTGRVDHVWKVRRRWEFKWR